MLSERQPLGYHKRPYALTSESLLLLGCLSLFIFVSSAYATNPTTYIYNTESKKIGVQLSQTCITAIKNKMPTNCPSYKDLAVADNTTKGFFGVLAYDAFDYFHRQRVMSPSYYNLVDVGHWVVAVDPTQQFIDGKNTRMIIVMAPGTLQGYADPNQVIGNNHTRTQYHDRYVDSSCYEARIAYNYTLYLDTISYMESGCKTTNYKDHENKQTNNTPFTYNNPYSSLHMTNYLMALLHNHQGFIGNHTAGGLGPSNCINHKCAFTDPYAKVGYK